MAASWRLSPQLGGQIDESTVRKQVPEIRRPADLSAILSGLSSLREFSHLEGYHEGEGWLIEGELAIQIAELSFRFTVAELFELTQTSKQKYLGEIHSPSTINKLSAELSQNLRLLGYLQNTVSISVNRRAGQAEYLVDITEGEPCTLAAIKSSFTLPPELSLGVRVGDICRSDLIRRALEDFSEALTKEGYLEATISKKDLEYSRDKRQATLVLVGSLGTKTSYQVNNPERSYLERFLGINPPPEGIDYSQVDQGEFERILRQRYHGIGYFDFGIRQRSLSESPEGNRLFRYDIAPGQQFYLGAVQFTGDTFFAEKLLLKTMELKNLVGDFYPPSNESIEIAVTKLKKLYQDQGFWEVMISTSLTKMRDQAGLMVLQVKINAHHQRIFRRLVLRNAAGEKLVAHEKIAELGNFLSDHPLKKADIFAFEDAVRSYYGQQGFSSVKIDIHLNSRVDKNSDLVEITATLSEGIREHIGKIKVLGLEKTQTKVVVRELHFASGDWYDTSKINQSRTALLRLGIFAEVRIIPLRQPRNDASTREVDIIVEVKEGNAGSVVFGPGFSLNRGMSYMGQVSYNNLFGSGRRFSLRTSISEERGQNSIADPGAHKAATIIGRKINLGLVEPWVFGFAADGTINYTYQATADQLRLFNDIFDLSISVVPPYFAGKNTLTPFLNLQINRTEGTSQQEDSLIATGSSRIFRSGLRLKTDRRNDVSWPTEGYLSKLTLAWANYLFASDFRFFQWSFTYNRYLGLSDNVVWVTSLSLAAFENIASTADYAILPASERLLAGGPDYVRGFSRQLGPYVKVGDAPEPPIGGSRRMVLKSDLRYKVSESFGTSLFVDGGNSFFSGDEIQNFQDYYARRSSAEVPYSIEDNLSYYFQDLLAHPDYLYTKNYFSYGASLSYITPLGPLVASAAWPWREPKSESCRAHEENCFSRATRNKAWPQWYLTIGSEF